MLHSRTITLIALGCSLAALLVMAAVAVYFPDFQWWAAGSAVALFPIAAFAGWLHWHRRGETPFQFLHAFKDAPAGLLLLDLGGRVKWANRCIEEILDQSLDEITDQAFADLLAGEAWETVAKKGFDDSRLFAAYLNTLKWNCVTSTDPRLFQSPFQAGIRLDAY